MPIVFDYKRMFCKVYEPFTKARLGALGEVEQCRHRDTNELYTVKVITNYHYVKNRHKHPDYIFMQDIEHLLEIKNENILYVKDVLHDKKEDSVYIVFEHVSGQFVQYDNNGRIIQLSEDRARTLFRQLLRGLDHLLLQYRTIHGSIAPENLLLGTNGDLKICGFSIKSKFPRPSRNTPKMNKFEYSKANDIWSCGMCLHLAIFGTLPPVGNVLAYVNKCKKISHELRSLFTRMLDEDPSTRISLNELLYDPWVTNNNALKPVETYIPRIQVEFCD
jgi:serine/threonine protein kinase